MQTSTLEQITSSMMSQDVLQCTKRVSLIEVVGGIAGLESFQRMLLTAT